MNMEKEIVFVTHNTGKIKSLKNILRFKILLHLIMIR